jgi:hypothetical protein
MTGLKRQTGEVTKQDKPLTMEIMLAIQDLLEEVWQCGNPREKLRAAQAGAWHFASFGCGLRGEEKPLVEFAGTRNSLRYLDPNFNTVPHFRMVVTGTNKQNRNCGAWFQIPCAATTQSGLKPGIWMFRYIDLLASGGITSGYLFPRHEGRAKLSDFEDLFYWPLERIQDRRPGSFQKIWTSEKPTGFGDLPEEGSRPMPSMWEFRRISFA